jgi:hypothetical protein
LTPIPVPLEAREQRREVVGVLLARLESEAHARVAEDPRQFAESAGDGRSVERGSLLRE